MTTNDPASVETLRLNAATARWALWQTRGQTIMVLLGLGFLLAASFGGLLVVLYFLRYFFNPGDISTGDALGFAFLCFCFLLIVQLVFGFATLAGFPFMRLLGEVINGCAWAWHKFRLRKVPVCIAAPFVRPVTWRDGHWPMLIIGVVAAGMYGLMILGFPPPLQLEFIQILLAGLLLSFVAFGSVKPLRSSLPPATPLSRFDIWMRERQQPQFQFIFAIIVICGYTFLSGVLFQDAAWRAIGVRKENVSVRLKEDDFKAALAYASKNGIIVNPCEQIGDDTTIRSADVLWQNFGTKALVIFPALLDATETRSRPTVRLEPKSEDIEVIKETNQVRCDEFGSDRLFTAGSVLLRDTGDTFLAEQFESLKKPQDEVKIRVVVHRDKSDKSQDASGKLMTQQQADTVKRMLQNTFGLTPAMIESIGEEDAVPKMKCTDDLTTTELRACQKMNRRVEIFVMRES